MDEEVLCTTVPFVPIEPGVITVKPEDLLSGEDAQDVQVNVGHTDPT